jgi:hypothetical protein
MQVKANHDFKNPDAVERGISATSRCSNAVLQGTQSKPDKKPMYHIIATCSFADIPSAGLLQFPSSESLLSCKLLLSYVPASQKCGQGKNYMTFYVTQVDMSWSGSMSCWVVLHAQRKESSPDRY